MRLKSCALLTVFALAAPASAQLLDEGFDYSTSGVFPPAGWTATDLGTTPIVWREASFGTGVQVLTADAAVHRWTVIGVPTDSWLISPVFSCAAATAPSASFDSELNDVEWMAHFSGPSGPLGNGASDLEVSADGGLTWSSEWQETAQADGYTPGIQVDLAAYAGAAAVQIAFRYTGDDGHEWAVDNARVEDTGNPGTPTLVLNGACPGPVTVSGSGMTPNGVVALAYGSQAGSAVLGAGRPCAGTTVDLLGARRIFMLAADANGNFSRAFVLPPQTCGSLFGQGLDLASCTATNLLAL